MFGTDCIHLQVKLFYLRALVYCYFMRCLLCFISFIYGWFIFVSLKSKCWKMCYQDSKNTVAVTVIRSFKAGRIYCYRQWLWNIMVVKSLASSCRFIFIFWIFLLFVPLFKIFWCRIISVHDFLIIFALNVGFFNYNDIH